MQGKGTIAGHPVHPPLVSVPIGSFVAAVVADVASIWFYHDTLALMSTCLIAFGIAAGLLAALFGFIDFLTAPMSAAVRRIAAVHGWINVAVLAIFGAAFAVRVAGVSPVAGYVLTAIGIVALAASGWIGGELVFRYRLGTREGESTSTASGRAARRTSTRIETT